jgi:phospholipid/cholesterol/gamma-HCH transport system permease protein
MINMLVSIGHATLQGLQRFGEAGILLGRTLFRKPQLKSFPLLIEQLYSEGILSLVIIVVSGLFIGMVVALQGYNVLHKFGAAQQLGPLVALSVVRELGPVVTGLLFAGRAGSALTAEIGLMKATDQLNAMEMMAVSPIQRVISPRFWAGFFSMPLLAFVFNTVAIFGAYLVAVMWLGLDAGSFWSNMQASVDFYDDVLNGAYKTVVFGFAIAWIAVYQGYYAKPTAEGIGRATTKTVVYSSLAILSLDFLLTAMMIGGW